MRRHATSSRTETHWSANGRAYTPLDVDQLRRWRTQESVTLVYRVVYLDGLRDQDTVDARFLGQLSVDFAAARSAGTKLVLRFSYTSTSSADAAVDRVLAHVSQLVPVVNQSACFLASDTDMGTFVTPPDRSWLAQQSSSTLTGGETCGVDAPRSDWTTAAQELAAYHFTYLNADFDRDVLGSWGSGLATASAQLGYRLRLTAASTVTSVDAGGHALVTLTLINDGYAAPVSSRPVRLVLRSAGSTTTTDLRLDVRSLAPGTTRTVIVDVAAPAGPGLYEMELALPDPAASLAGRPEYAVQLANQGTWDAVHATNDLLMSLRVTPRPEGRPPTVRDRVGG